MIAVAPYHVRHIALNPFFEEVERTLENRFSLIPTFYPFPLGELPLVRSLVHYKQAKTVAQIVHNRSLRVMAQTDSIGT